MVTMAFPGEPCQIQPRPDWTAQEKWAWKHVCEGIIADFNEGEEYGGRLDPKTSDGWPESRVLRPAFLETILLHEPYRSSVPRQGVRISGAWFKDHLDLSNATLAHPLYLEGCRFDLPVDLSFLRTFEVVSLGGSAFEAEVNMRRAKIDRGLAMHSCKFAGNLTMDSLEVNGDLYMHEHAEFADVNLNGCKIAGHFDMSGSLFTGNLTMNGLKVGGALLMRKVTASGEVDLGGGNIVDQISMIGAHFRSKLNMNGLQVGGLVSMSEGAEFAEVDLTSAKIGRQLSMIGSKFTGGLIMNNVEVSGSLFMRDGAEFAEVSLVKAMIENDLSMIGSQFKGKLNMNGVLVRGSLLMRGPATFAEVHLGATRIGGSVDMSGSRFNGNLDMRSSNVGGMLAMGGGATFRDANLAGAKIEGEFSVSGSTFAGRLNMFGLYVGQTMLAGNSKFEGDFEVSLIFADIGGNLDIAGSGLPSLDLTGTKVRGTFRLGSEDRPPVRWRTNATLTLRNTEVESFQDRMDTWPGKLELDGFQYTSLSELSHRQVCWFIEWLGKQPLYSPQPYQQLANVLRKAGHRQRANDVLYAGKERERKQAKGRQWAWLTALKWVIGYGFRIYYTLPWLLALIVAGALVLRVTNQGPLNGMPYGFSYSVDMLLPIIELSKRHYEIPLEGFARYYFYFHKLMGWILASFIVAGITGLTEKA
ncbi:MAG: hypothetical protein ACREKR_05150 [Candidatus Methylomirabilales bacterium]